MAEIEIRTASVIDIPTIKELAHRIWPVVYDYMISQEQIAYMLELMYSEQALGEQMNEKGHHFVLALEDGEPVGFASYSRMSDECFRLQKLYVLSEKHGAGIGKKLLDYVVERAGMANATKLDLTVNRNNKTLHFYKKHGFEIARAQVFDIGAGFVMDDYVMERALKSDTSEGV